MDKKKILFVATVKSHIGQFHMPFIHKLKNDGHEIHAAFKDNSEEKKGLDISGIDLVFNIPIARSPFKTINLIAYKKLKRIISENEYDIIHCHTPMGAVVTRLAAKNAKSKAKVIYTAHGFHFYKGASLKNWFFYYSIEKYLSKYTDCLITINQEDYDTALRKGFKMKDIRLIHGVGVDISKFSVVDNEIKKELREKKGFSVDDFILIYPADLSVRKNQQMLLKVVSILKNEIPNLKLLLPGQPILIDKYKELAVKSRIDRNIEFLGYRRDMDELIALADVAVSSSKQEGLPVNLLEAMACGKPVVATNVRGNADLVKGNGYLCSLNDFKDMADKIYTLYKNNDVLYTMGIEGRRLVQSFTIDSVNSELGDIYRRFI